MTKRAFEKILNNQVQSAADLEMELIAFHNEHPNVTQLAFEQCKTKAGLTSYQVLAKSLPKNAKIVVDLACGSGPLLKELITNCLQLEKIYAIDLSEAELYHAKSKNDDERIEFITAAAQKLPLADASVDALCCHLALMLFNHPAQVLKELSRVLRPNGFIAAVVLLMEKKDELFTAMMGLFSRVLNEEHPDLEYTGFGGPQTSTKEGLKTLFGDDGVWTKLEFSNCQIALCGSSEYVAASLMQSFYATFLLSDGSKQKLQKLLIPLFDANKTDKGVVEFYLPFSFFCARKIVS